MKFIVLEGLDGAGKSTQIELLTNYFKSKGLKYKYLHFPRTNSPVYGDLIARFLRGELGEINTVHPYLVALIYAGDRENASLLINKWLEKKYYVIVDRYVYSNIAFQCAKLTNNNKRDELKDWIKMLEYEYFNIPKPDISMFLDVPFSFTKANLEEKRTGSDREYLNGAEDIHEQSMNFQNKVYNVYSALLESENNFFNINCKKNNIEILPKEDIFENIIELLNQHKII